MTAVSESPSANLGLTGLDELQAEVEQLRGIVDLGILKNKALILEKSHLHLRIQDLEDESNLSAMTIIRQSNTIDQQDDQMQSLKERNESLWLANAGLRYDLTRLIVGEDEDSGFIEEVLKEAELDDESLMSTDAGSSRELTPVKEEGSEDDFHGETPVEGTEKWSHGLDGSIDWDASISQGYEEVVDKAEAARANALIGR